ncbi:MAG: ParB/RepB/Spo0J family partition protein [Cyanobacteria bacterium P01_E01_bin.42]
MSSFNALEAIGDIVNAKQENEEIVSLYDELDEKKAEIQQLTEEIQRLRDRGHGDSEAKLEELRTVLEGREIQIPIERIKRNPEQPRQTFPDESIASLAHSMDKEKQLVAVLVFLDGEDYILFDGERRWLAASLLNWTTLKSIVIPKPEELHKKVLIAMLEREDLNTLDLAEALMKEAIALGLEKERIPTLLHAAIRRLERAKRLSELTRVAKAETEAQQDFLASTDFNDDERKLFEFLLSLQLNPATVNLNVFPVLSYFEDIRHAIREGLGIANAKLLQKLSPKNLNLTETKARNIRKNLCDRVLKEKLTKEKTKALVNETLAKHNPKDEEKITARQTAKAVKSIESIAVDEMNSEQLQAIREAMQAKLAQIDAQLT